MLLQRTHKILLIAAALAVVYFIYKLGTTGALFYDDYGNLEGLAGIQSWEDAKRFAFNGMAGPLGRPLSLLSFVPHASGWPGNSAEILAFNVLIHLINALLLGLLGYMLLGVTATKYNCNRFRIAFFAALLWAAMPLLASSSLIAIQRMTGLSALFGLIGLLGFIWGYRLQYSRPVLAFVVQMGALGSATLLSMLAKENGALFPIYALLIDALLVKSATPAKRWLIIVRRSILALGLLSILVYLSPLVQDYFSISQLRGYSAWDRLQTQVVVLWQYLKAAFLPVPSLYGPFHDHRGADYAGWTSFIAFSAWLLAALFCVFLYIKKNLVWPLFALLWFFVSHLIESTSIMLEIYFEHRNYLALYGFCLAISVAVASVTKQYEKLATALFGMYIAIQLCVLFFVTSMWGKADLSAEVWAQENPSSSRAALHVVFQGLGKGDADETARYNTQFIARQRYEYAIEILDRTSSRCETCLDVRMQAIVYSCLIHDAQGVKRRMSEMMEVAAGGKGTRAVLDTLFRLRELVNAGSCNALQRTDLIELIERLAENNLFRIDHILTRLYFVAAAIMEDMDNHLAKDRYLSLAESASPVALPILQYQVNSAYKKGNKKEAIAAINRRYEHVRFNSGAMTKEVLDELLSEINQEQE